MFTIEADSDSKERRIASFLSELGKIIQDSLTEAENEKFPEIQKLVVKIYQEIGVDDVFFDINNPDAITRASIAVALAGSWLMNESSFSKRESLSNHFLDLFVVGDRTYVETDSVLSNVSLRGETAMVILKSVFLDDGIDWDNVTYPEILNELKDENNIVRLPIRLKPDHEGEKSPAYEFLKRIYEDKQVPEGQRRFFKGFFNPPTGVVVLWIDSPLEAEVHESHHAKNRGLLAGDLGFILDEGMTDHLTYQVLKDEHGYSSADIALIQSKSKYTRTVRIVERLLEIPTLKDNLLSLYKTQNKESATVVVKEIIKLLGLEYYMKLYTALPGSTEEREVLNRIESIMNPEEVNEIPGFSFSF